MPSRISIITIISFLFLGYFLWDKPGLSSILAFVSILLMGVGIAHLLGKTERLLSVPYMAQGLNWLTNNLVAAQPVVSSTSTTQNNSNPSQSKKPKKVDRKKMLAESIQTFKEIKGIDSAIHELEKNILTPTLEAHNKGLDGLGIISDAMVVVFYGPEGTFKSKVAKNTVKLLCGQSVLENDKLVLLDKSEIRSFGGNSPTEVALNKAELAMGGALLIENADWLLEEDAMQGVSPVAEFFQGLRRAAEAEPHKLLIMLTIQADAGHKLLSEESWQKKFDVRRVKFDHLNDDGLMNVFNEMARLRNFNVSEDVVKYAGSQLLEIKHSMDRRFDNSEAVRRFVDACHKTNALRISELRGLNNQPLTMDQESISIHDLRNARQALEII